MKKKPTKPLPAAHPQRKPAKKRKAMRNGSTLTYSGDPEPPMIGQPRAIPCGEDAKVAEWGRIHAESTIVQRLYADGLPPGISAYPWPLKLANWLDAAPTRLRTYLAGRLTALAGWVTP